ncbi:MAG: aspartate/tyrosine/aromatic aminotransferase [Opitutae bacterium]|nr:aspartate/tyrosine/aromatic aminotransferase [Opitutae bacterium]
MFFNQIETAPADPILGLTEAFRKDPRATKVNLGVGVFVDDKGTTPVLECIRRAERLLWETEKTKGYTPISGPAEYGEAVAHLVFGSDFNGLATNRVAVAQTPGGTGALRVGAELLKDFRKQGAVWMPNPTWGNHGGIFTAAGLATKSYPYYDPATQGVDVEAMCAALEKIPAGDVVLLHVCCHNPTGADLDSAQWARVGDIAAKAGWLPFFDFAYQGFGAGLEEDRAGLLAVMQKVPEALVASSFSKNMGLYGERVGALLLVAECAKGAAAGLSQVKRLVRVLYSNPPKHGAALARMVLEDAELRRRWVQEVETMRLRIQSVRQQLVAGLAARETGVDFSFIVRQNGMFSFSGLGDAQVDFLRAQKAIYMVKGGRINVAGLMAESLEYVCDSIAESLKL